MDGEKRKMKRFGKDFKVSAVKMVTEGGNQAFEVARSLGIHANVLYSWKRKHTNDGDKALVGKGHLTEMSTLRKELRETQMERDILKKQAAYFQKKIRTVQIHRQIQL
jgi:transposase